jgi:membrane-anchored mycosin MYCP
VSGRRLLGSAARVAVAAAVGLGATSALPAPALAFPGPMRELTPPVVSGPPPSEGPIAPSVPTKQAFLCTDSVATRSDYISQPPSLAMLNIEQAWKFSRGAGQRVAVIDTGVFRHPRLSVTPGGDYVSGGDGTSDCDGHGTWVAGIIAARQSPDDGFAGVAPDASIIAIRQSSKNFGPVDSKQSPPGAPIEQGGTGDVTTLARAVVRAVNLGATVINISEGACQPASANMGDRALGAAVKYAFDRNVVVVAAADNVAQGREGCSQQNPDATGGRDADPWASVVTKSSPAYFSPYVVSVGAVADDGRPADYSLAGPWVTVAAPGDNHISLNTKPTPAIVDGAQRDNGVEAITGTSFAAPMVSGLAALIRARYPQLTAAQVINRITRTAHHPADGRDGTVGYGLIDPVTALTTTTPDIAPADANPADPRTGDTRNVFAQQALQPAPAAPAPNPVPRYIAIGAAAGAALLTAIIWTLMRRRDSERRRLEEGVDY